MGSCNSADVNEDVNQERVQCGLLGVLRLDYYYPPAPGDIDHPASYAYDVIYRVVPGFTFEMCQTGTLTPEVEKEYKDAVDFLVQQGVSCITGDCGFMMYFQEMTRQYTNIPVFMSALCLLPAVTCAYGKKEKIAIFTANGKSLEPMRNLIKEECGVEIHDSRYVIVGCEDIPGFEAVALGTKVDYDKTVPGVVARAREIIAKHSDVRAFLFECTELPQFSDAVRHATKLPVWDAITASDCFVDGFTDNPRFGKQNWTHDPTRNSFAYAYGANLTPAQRDKLINSGPDLFWKPSPT